MASYPVLLQDAKSRRKPVNSIKVDLAGDGTPRGRVMHSKTVYNFTVTHPLISTIDRDSIQTFYDTNKDLEFTFVWDADGLSYTLMFLGEPDPTWVAAGYWNVTMNAIGTKI